MAEGRCVPLGQVPFMKIRKELELGQVAMCHLYRCQSPLVQVHCISTHPSDILDWSICQLKAAYCTRDFNASMIILNPCMMSFPGIGMTLTGSLITEEKGSNIEVYLT